ncbi:MAG: riboflavin biosynthesis protein RibF [Synergistaceae bacterium]|jgi:riboflavin kinase/FMN adenylyltransferase|nr:riboflavin biosynthesis protein RibF [Synergistaceae bacterium]
MIAAIGAFDGFHRGHQDLLRRACALAEANGATWGTVTFDRHPDSLLSPGQFKSLFTSGEQASLEKFFSVPAARRMKFTAQMAAKTPEEFLDCISDEFGVRGVVVGEGFRFGRNRMGTTATLEGECRDRGWAFEIAPTLKDSDGNPVSSTLVREAVASGDMRRAWELLGYPFFCSSAVTRGNERGRRLGFPTANIEISPEKIPMRRGVYAALVLALGKWHVGAANIGLNPTFEDVGDTRFEINLLDFDGDLYSRKISAFLLEHVRDERRFDGAQSLKAQISRDSETIRGIGDMMLAKHAPLWGKFKESL